MFWSAVLSFFSPLLVLVSSLLYKYSIYVVAFAGNVTGHSPVTIFTSFFVALHTFKPSNLPFPVILTFAIPSLSNVILQLA